jgi:hypothetical protein
VIAMLPGMPKKRSHRRPRPATRQPVVIRPMEPAGLLQHVPELLPVDPVDSLVLVLFRRSRGTKSRTHGAMRLDLRHTEDPEELDAWAAAILGQALRVDGVTGVAVVAYTPETFAPSGRPPAAPQVRAVARQAERMGLEVLDRFCVAADGWGSLDDPRLPRGGRDLALIESPEPRGPRLGTAEELPLAPLEQRRRFDEGFVSWWTRADGPGGVLHGVALAQSGSAFGIAAEAEPAMDRYRWGRDVEGVVDLIEGMLEPHGADEDGPCACRALLLAIAERQGLLNLLLAQIAWGPAFGTELWTAVNAPVGRDRSLDRMVTALGGGRFRRPDTDRILVAIAALRETASYVVPENDRSGLDDALAWLHWACGGSSTAARYAMRAMERRPDRDIAPIVLGKVQRGELPAWAFRADPAKTDPFEALLQAQPAAG